MNCRNIRSYCKIASLWLPVAPWDVLSTLGTLNTGHIAWPTIQSQVQNPFFMAPFPPLREGNTAIKRMVNTKMKIVSLLVQCQFKSVGMSSLDTKSMKSIRSVLWTGLTDSLNIWLGCYWIEHHGLTHELSRTSQGELDGKIFRKYSLKF